MASETTISFWSQVRKIFRVLSRLWNHVIYKINIYVPQMVIRGNVKFPLQIPGEGSLGLGSLCSKIELLCYALRIMLLCFLGLIIMLSCSCKLTFDLVMRSTMWPKSIADRAKCIHRVAGPGVQAQGFRPRSSWLQVHHQHQLKELLFFNFKEEFYTISAICTWRLCWCGSNLEFNNS